MENNKCPTVCKEFPGDLSWPVWLLLGKGLRKFMYKRLTFFCIHFVFWFLFRCDINFKLKAVNQRNPYWIMSHRGFLKLGMSQKPLKGRHLLLKRSFHVFCLGTVTTPLICTQQLVQATGSPLANTHTHTHTHTHLAKFFKKGYT